MWKHPLNSSQLLPTETWAPHCLASHVPKEAENPAINSQYRKQLTIGQMYLFGLNSAVSCQFVSFVGFISLEEVPTRSSWLASWSGHPCRLQTTSWEAAMVKVSGTRRGLKECEHFQTVGFHPKG